MQRRFVRIAILALVGCSLLRTGFAEQAADQPAGGRYVVQVTADMTMELPVGEQKLDAVAEFDYTWRAVDGAESKELELLLHGLMLKANIGGRPLADLKMNRDGMTMKQDGETRDVAADSNENVKKLLTQCFESPLFRVVVDEHGKVISRKNVSGPLARSILGRNGAIDSAAFFHAPFYADKKTWKHEVALATSQNRLWKGELTYVKSDERGAEGKPHLVRVEVSGELTADGADGIKESSSKLSGHQVYDTKNNVWVSGKLEGPQKFKATEKGIEVAAKGKFVVSLKRQDD